jgi:HTH-type transcriptional regulator/antitoxin HipB
MSRNIIFYRTDDGNCPVEEFLAPRIFKEVSKDPQETDKESSRLSPRLPCPKKEVIMSDVEKYISKRKKKDPKFAEGFEEGYKEFKIGVLLKQAREKAGLTQEQLAKKLRTKKIAISRIENHAQDIKLSTIQKVAKALGKNLEITLS